MKIENCGQTKDGYFYICDQCGEIGPTVVWKNIDADRDHFALCEKCIEKVFAQFCDVAWHQEIIVNRKHIPESTRNLVFARDNYMCRRCGSEKDLVVDHVKPFSRGGETKLENLQTLCRSCNIKKGAHIVPDGWYKNCQE